MSQESSNKTTVVISIVGVILAAVAIWWFGIRDGRDQVAKAQDEFNEVLKGGELQEAPEDIVKRLNLPEGAKVRVVKADGDSPLKNLANLSEDQMQEFAKGILPGAMSAGSKEAQRILDLPPKEQKKALDEMIDRQQAAKESLKGLIEGKSGTNTEVTRSDDGSNVEIRQTISVNGGEGLDGERMMMEFTSPEQRAVMDEFKKLMAERMEERGLESDGGTMIILGAQSSTVSTSSE